jgi:hypothetical protein
MRGSPPFAKAGMLSPEDSRLLAQAEAVAPLTGRCGRAAENGEESEDNWGKARLDQTMDRGSTRLLANLLCQTLDLAENLRQPA